VSALEEPEGIWEQIDKDEYDRLLEQAEDLWENDKTLARSVWGSLEHYALDIHGLTTYEGLYFHRFTE